MSARTQTQAVAAPSAKGTASVTGLLQRKCDCGGKASGLTGDCGACAEKKRRGIQTKLRVGPASDHFEQEADRVADEVLRGPTQGPNLSDAAGTQRRAVTPVGPSPAGETDAPPAVQRALDSSGQPLDSATRNFMEGRFGHDFGRVRVHADEQAEVSARAVDALAYTIGDNVFFAAGQYAPHTHEGRRLLAHELTHVLQQGGGSPQAGSVQTQRRGVLQRQADPRKKATILSAEQIKADPSRKQAYGYVGQPPKALVCDSTAKEPNATNCLAEVKPGTDVTIISGQPGAGWMQIENTGAFTPYGPKQVIYILGVFAKEIVKPAAPAAPKAAEKVEEKPAVKASQPPLYDWTTAPDAYSGITPYFKVKTVPHYEWTDTTKNMKHGPYRLVNNLRRNGDGSSSIVFYNAFRYVPGLAGPTNWDEWIIGPDSIQKFIDNVQGYAGAGAAAYMFGPPPPNAVEGARFVENLLMGRPVEAAKAYKDALYESVTDPNWWVQMITAGASLAKAMSPAPVRVPGAISGPAMAEGAAGRAAPVMLESGAGRAAPAMVESGAGRAAPAVLEGAASKPPTLAAPSNVSSLPKASPANTLPRGGSAPSGGGNVVRTGPKPSGGGGRTSASGSGDFAWRGGGAAEKVDPHQYGQPIQVKDFPRAVPANDLAPAPAPVQPAPAPVQPAPALVPAQPAPAVVPGATPAAAPVGAPGVAPNLATVAGAGASLSPTPGAAAAPAPQPYPFPEAEEERKTGKCPTGLSKSDPIKMIWLKPFKYYKSRLKLYGGDYSPFIPQRLLYAGKKYGSEFSTIGVKPSGWPVVGSTIHRVTTPRDTKITKTFIDATTDEGFGEWSENSPDHVLDLFFEGADHFKNLWPLEREPNVRAGHWHANQSVCYCPVAGAKPRVESLQSAPLVNRWFVIRAIGDPPPMTPWK